MKQIHHFSLVVITLCSLTMFFCSATDNSEFTQNRNKWEQAAISNYSFTITYTGFVPSNKSTIRVKNSTVASVLLVDQGTTIADSLCKNYPRIDDLFDEIDKNITDGVLKSVSYNTQYGFPEKAYRSYGEEGDGFEITGFAPEN